VSLADNSFGFKTFDYLTTKIYLRIADVKRRWQRLSSYWLVEPCRTRSDSSFSPVAGEIKTGQTGSDRLKKNSASASYQHTFVLQKFVVSYCCCWRRYYSVVKRAVIGRKVVSFSLKMSGSKGNSNGGFWLQLRGCCYSYHIAWNSHLKSDSFGISDRTSLPSARVILSDLRRRSKSPELIGNVKAIGNKRRHYGIADGRTPHCLIHIALPCRYTARLIAD